MDEYFKFKFWKEIISIGLVALLIVSLALTTLFYKTSPNDFLGINERNYKNKIVRLFAKSEGWISVGSYNFEEEE